MHGIEFPSDKYYRVLVTLLDYADQDGTRAHPGNDRLAEDCHCSADHIRKKILPWLKARGFITLTKQGRHRVGASEWSFPAAVPRSTAGHLDTRLPEDDSRAYGHLSAGSQPGLQRPAHQINTKTTGCEPGGFEVVGGDCWVTSGSADADRDGGGSTPALVGQMVGRDEHSAVISTTNEMPIKLDPWGPAPTPRATVQPPDTYDLYEEFG